MNPPLRTRAGGETPGSLHNDCMRSASALRRRCVFFFLAAACLLPAGAAKPNVIVILFDDLGRGDIGAYGNTVIRTPNLDRIAAEGVRLTEFYSPSPTCSPARAALLTGRHPLRTGVTRVFVPKEKWGLPASEITLAEHLQSAGYATACIGKWHLGGRKAFRPKLHGFDRFYGVLYSNDMTVLPLLKWPRFELFEEDTPVESPAAAENLTQNYTAQAIHFLRAKSRQPFFLYLAHTMPHIPLAVSAEFAGKSRYGLYGDVVEELDSGIGRVLDTVEDLGIDDETFVFVTSDNGPWPGDPKTPGGSTGGLRGSKGTTWEGGLRAPFLARAPGRLPAGETRDGIATLMDLFPTISAVAGLPLPAGVNYDGSNILGLLEGRAASPHERVFFSDTRKIHAVRSGFWKLKLYERSVDRKGRTRPARENETPELYNLAEDLGERRDVARSRPDVVAHMLAEAREFQDAIEPTMKLPPRGRSVINGLLTHGPKRPEKMPR